MQDFGIDYYSEDDPGCCLICEQAEENCLCRNCKCRKCFHYDNEDKSCDIATDAKNEKNIRNKFYQREYKKYHKKIPQTNLKGEHLEVNV